jgi:hypothetical protein
MQTGSSETLIGWKSGKTTYVPLWDGMEGAQLYGLYRVADVESVDQVQFITAFVCLWPSYTQSQTESL